MISLLQQIIPDIAAFQMYMTFGIIIVAIILFASEKIALEISVGIILLTLLLFFHFFPVPGPEGNALGPYGILKGFADPVLFTILSLLVIGQGLFQTGAMDRPAQALSRFSRYGMVISFSIVLITAGAVSAFMNNTPVVVIFIPIVTAIAARLERSPSQLLMPLSYITILGGMTTLIGSSSNLIVSTFAAKNGMEPFGFFDFFVPGIFLASIGAVYTIFVLPYIMPEQEKNKNQGKAQSGKQFIAQVNIRPTHPWEGVEAQAGMFPKLKDLTVRLIQRDNRVILPPFEDVRIESGDVVIVAATRTALTDVAKLQENSLPAYQSRSADHDEADIRDREDARTRQMTMVEAVVSPASRLIGLNIDQATSQMDTGCQIFGIERQSRMLRRPMHSINLEAGDVLLLLGTRGSIRSLRTNRSLITLAGSAFDLPITHHAQRAMLIFLLTISLAVSGLVPIAISALAGAAAMIAFGCLNTRQAWRAVDRRIYMLIGTAFALAAPLEITGGATYIAQSVVSTFSGLGPTVLLSAFFLLTATLTNFLSNHATAAILTPVAVRAAAEINIPPEAFVYGLIFALNCSFATPIAYQTNLIVMGPGHYSFRDYLYAGLPLILLIWLAYTIFAPFYFGL